MSNLKQLVVRPEHKGAPGLDGKHSKVPVHEAQNNKTSLLAERNALQIDSFKECLFV